MQHTRAYANESAVDVHFFELYLLLYSAVLYLQSAEVLKTVQDFCRSPEITKLKSGWATAPGDKSSTQARDCDLCGTIWIGSIKESDLPHTFDVWDTYTQRNTLEKGYVSLACPPGRLVIRTVYKILTAHDPSNGYAHLMLHPFGELGSLGSDAIRVYRCDLVLPDF